MLSFGNILPKRYASMKMQHRLGQSSVAISKSRSASHRLLACVFFLCGLLLAITGTVQGAVMPGLLEAEAERASEVLRIEVLQRISLVEDRNSCAFVYELTYRARVLEVARSATGLGVGDELIIRYHTTQATAYESGDKEPESDAIANESFQVSDTLKFSARINPSIDISRIRCVGGSRPPILEKGQTVFAFLEHRQYRETSADSALENKRVLASYSVAAGTMSFSEKMGMELWTRIVGAGKH